MFRAPWKRYLCMDIYIYIYIYILQDISLEKKKSSIYFPETVGRGEMDNLLFYFFVGNILCIFQLRLTVKCDLDIFIGSPLYRWVNISFYFIYGKIQDFFGRGRDFFSFEGNSNVGREIAMQAGKYHVGREMAGSISLQFYAHTPNLAETKKYVYIYIYIYRYIFVQIYHLSFGV